MFEREFMDVYGTKWGIEPFRFRYCYCLCWWLLALFSLGMLLKSTNQWFMTLDTSHIFPSGSFLETETSEKLGIFMGSQHWFLLEILQSKQNWSYDERPAGLRSSGFCIWKKLAIFGFWTPPTFFRKPGYCFHTCWTIKSRIWISIRAKLDGNWTKMWFLDPDHKTCVRTKTWSFHRCQPANPGIFKWAVASRNGDATTVALEKGEEFRENLGANEHGISQKQTVGFSPRGAWQSNYVHLLGCAADFGAAGAKRLVSAYGVRGSELSKDPLVSFLLVKPQFQPHKARKYISFWLFSLFCDTFAVI